MCYYKKRRIPTKTSCIYEGGSMKFSFAHNNINVKDLDKSLAFYKEALLLEESRRLEDKRCFYPRVFKKSLYST